MFKLICFHDNFRARKRVFTFHSWVERAVVLAQWVQHLFSRLLPTDVKSAS